MQCGNNFRVRNLKFQPSHNTIMNALVRTEKLSLALHLKRSFQLSAPLRLGFLLVETKLFFKCKPRVTNLQSGGRHKITISRTFHSTLTSKSIIITIEHQILTVYAFLRKLAVFTQLTVLHGTLSVLHCHYLVLLSFG